MFLDVYKRQVTGSNLFNILLVLGLAAVINPISMSMLAFIDIIFMVLITLLPVSYTHLDVYKRQVWV